MIMTVEELKQFVSTTIDDSVLEARLQALELSIRKYTNNNFQNRNKRFECPIVAGKLFTLSPYFDEGDTIQISDSQFSNGVYVIKDIDSGLIELDGTIYDEANVTVTKVEYPMDVKIGVINLFKWDLDMEGKRGVSSETISRHSVTYFDMNGDNSSIGYPKALTGFLKPYMKARF